MSFASKNQKLEQECRIFNNDWSCKYMFIDVQSKAVCLLCQDSVAVFKEYDLKRHHQTKHMDFGINLSQKNERKSIELIQKLKKQQTVFTKQSSLQEASTEASSFTD